MSKSFPIAFVLTLFASVSGQLLSKIQPFNLVGALVISLLIGMLLGLIKPLKRSCGTNIGWISNKFLRAGIIFLGFKLNLELLFQSGIKSILIAMMIVIFSIVVNFLLCRYLFREDEELSLLTACGCGICGAAAVIGVSPQLKASKDSSIIAVAVVCILGTVFTLVDIFIQRSGLFSLTVIQYGFMAGGSLHEIAHAVAAGNAIQGAEQIAVITKLSRVLMLAPVALFVGLFHNRHKKGKATNKLPVPYFMGGFLFTAILGSYLSLPTNIINLFISLAYLLLGMAMAALGMSVHFHVIKEKGLKTLLGALIGSVLQLSFCIVLAKLFF